ncbi:MAG: hypothetical protein WCP35_12705 [Verrucomicrobiota bacterium]
MKTTMTSACLAALLILGNIASAQTAALDQFGIPIPEAPPQTTKMRVESLKARQTDSLSALKAALNRIAGDPTLITAKETFGAIDRADRADRDMKRTKCASASILAALRTELTAIKTDTAYADDQRVELEAAAKALAEECITVRKKADAVTTNLAKAYKALAQWKKIYKSYLNLQGEIQAKSKLKAAVERYVKTLAESPAEAPAEAPAPDSTNEEKKSA